MRVKRRTFYIGLLLLLCNPYFLQAGNNKTTPGSDVRNLQLAVFDIDVTPPVGTHLTYDTFRQALAEGAGTVSERVALHTVYQHDAPICYEGTFAREVVNRLRTANPDFPGLACLFRQLSVPEALHVNFNGAGGDIGAGKYNDGSKENRLLLAERLADGMRRAWESTKKEPVSADCVNWFVEPVSFPASGSIKKAGDWIRTADPVYLANNLFKSAWLSRINAGKQIDITCLKIGKARIPGFPGEPFVAYQLSAKSERPDLFVTVAGRRLCTPGYILTAEAYKQGGYCLSRNDYNKPGIIEHIIRIVNNNKIRNEPR
jgi:hypothetical protein